MSDEQMVRQALDQYEAWGIREGYTMQVNGKPALDRILAQRADLLAALEEMWHAAENGLPLPWKRIHDAITAAHQGEGT